MSLYDYRASQEIAQTDPPFYALIMAALRKADSANSVKIETLWPGLHAEFTARYNAPGGVLPTDPEAMPVCAGCGCRLISLDDDRTPRSERTRWADDNRYDGPHNTAQDCDGTESGVHEPVSA